MSELLLSRGGSAQASGRRLAFAAFLLATLGLLVQIAVSGERISGIGHPAVRQGFYWLLALPVGWCAYLFGYRRALQWSRPALVVTWAMLGFLLVPGAAHIGGGSARWIGLGSFGHVQPSEVAKIVIILFFSRFAAQRREVLGTFRQGFLPAMTYLGVTAGLILVEPDFGQTVFLFAISAAVLLVNGLRLRHFIPAFAVAVPLLYLVMREKFAYIGSRVDGFLAGSHYQVEQGLRFLSAGGVAGQTFGNGRAQLFVPEIRNDFALVAVGEHGGFLGVLLVIVLFMVLLHQGLRVAWLARDEEGFSVAFGIAWMVALQAAFNVAVVTNIAPPKGIALPFVSAGGSSLLMGAAAVGLLASVARDARDPAAVLHAARAEPELVP